MQGLRLWTNVLHTESILQQMTGKGKSWVWRLIEVTFKFPAGRMIYGIGTKIYTRQNFVVCCSTAAMPNEISIRTDKGEYVGGDTVFG